VEKHSKRKDVGRVSNDHICFGCFENFGSDVARSSASFVEQVFFSDPAGQPEVSDDVIFALVRVDPHHDIFQFQITMYDSFLSHVLDAFGKIFGYFELLSVCEVVIL